MLDPRIYRTGLVVVVLAVIVFAFSLEGQQGGLGMNTTLPPDAFNGLNAYHDMLSLARPNRTTNRNTGSHEMTQPVA